MIHTAIVQIPQINDEKRLGYEVNAKGTQNVCEVVKENASIKGIILTGWHTIGSKGYAQLSNGLSGLDCFEMDESGNSSQRGSTFSRGIMWNSFLHRFY